MVWESLMKIMSPSLSFVVGGTMTMLTLTEAPLCARLDVVGGLAVGRGIARRRFGQSVRTSEVTARASVGKHVGELGAVEPRLTLNTSGESSASFHVITMTPSSTSTLGFFVEFGFRRATSASSFAASSVWKMPRPGLASAVLAAMRMPSDGASTSPERHDASRAASFYAWRRRVDVFESPPPRRTSYRARFPPFRRWIRR